MATFTVKQGDTLPALTATLVSANGSKANLSNATILFRMSDLYTTNLIEASAEILDPANGKVAYYWADGETAEAGRFYAEFVVTYASGKQETFPNTDPINVTIIRDLV